MAASWESGSSPSIGKSPSAGIPSSIRISPSAGESPSIKVPVSAGAFSRMALSSVTTVSSVFAFLGIVLSPFHGLFSLPVSFGRQVVLIGRLRT